MAEVNMDFNRDKVTDDVNKMMVEVPEKHADKVISGEVKTKKRSLIKRFTDIFFKESLTDVKTYIVQDVIVPAICENIVDIITSTAGMLFLGEATRRIRGRGQSNGSKISYDKMYNGRQEKMPSYSRSKLAYNFDDIWFENRGDAELVLESMFDILNSEYRQVTVADLYDLVGKSTTFTQNKYGWRDLRGARVAVSPSRGYFLDLPKCMALD